MPLWGGYCGKRAELADALRVHPETIRRRIADGTIRAMAIGRVLRVPATELERLLDQSGFDVGEHRPVAKGLLDRGHEIGVLAGVELGDQTRDDPG